MLFILENYMDTSFQDAIAREQELRDGFLGSCVSRELLQGEVQRQASGCMYFVLNGPKHGNPDLLEGPALDSGQCSHRAATLRALTEPGPWSPRLSSPHAAWLGVFVLPEPWKAFLHTRGVTPRGRPLNGLSVPQQASVLPTPPYF